MDKKRYDIPSLNVDWYYGLIIGIGIVAALYNGLWWAAAVQGVALVTVIVWRTVLHSVGLRRMRDYFDRVSQKLGGAATESMAGFPFPVAILNSSGKITWYNKELDNVFEGELLFQKDIRSIVENFDVEKVMATGKSVRRRTRIGDRSFEVWAHRVQSSRDTDGELAFAYFIDISNYAELLERYEDEKCVSVMITVDSYEEVIKSADEENRARLIAKVERTLLHFTLELSGILKKLEKDNYYLIIKQGALRTLISKKFDILEKIREIPVPTNIPLTLSIGIGAGGDTLTENDAFARAATDMALGRGGDQAVVKDGKSFKYFGGKTREVEKRTKVKARVVSYALRELMSQSDQVIVMGHKNADIDCVGAGVGLLSVMRGKGLRSFMVLNEYDKTVGKVIEKLQKNEKYAGAFIKSDYAREIITPKTLLIIVDTHKISYVDDEVLLSKTEQIAIIDHHRRSADFIENSVLLYHEPYASSAGEMVTEMLQYMDDRLVLSSIEAEALYAGIYMDTKGFTMKTGVRTLEAAAYLRRAGVDPISVKQLFATDFDMHMKRTGIVSAAQIYRDGIAISASEERVTQDLIARASDELMEIASIDASFVLAAGADGCLISGRSNGRINVQVILEELGGGGHMTVAGAQIKNVTVPEAKEMLLRTIDKYFEE